MSQNRRSKKILKQNKYTKAIKNLNKEGVGIKINAKDEYVILSYHPVTTELFQNEIYIRKILNVLKDLKYKKDNFMAKFGCRFRDDFKNCKTV